MFSKSQYQTASDIVQLANAIIWLRSEGYAKQSSFGLGMGGVINMILDPCSCS